MLLFYKRPAKTPSQLENYGAETLTNENVKTFWIAKENNADQWVEIDLNEPGLVHAVQVN